jgi:hypothetical protein
MQSFRFGEVTVDIRPGLTITTLADGPKVPADHAEQPGQAELAAAHGYDHMIGLGASPTLAGVAAGKHFRYWQVEEAAVLALQGFCKVAGVDLMELARRYSSR